MRYVKAGLENLCFGPCFLAGPVPAGGTTGFPVSGNNHFALGGAGLVFLLVSAAALAGALFTIYRLAGIVSRRWPAALTRLFSYFLLV
jgi:hypothetical protein